MKNNLFRVIDSFSNEQSKRFARFIRSPYFNRENPQRKLLTELTGFRGRYDDPHLTREYLWNRIYPGKAYKNSTIVNLLSDVFHQAKKFLAVEELLQDGTREDLYFLRSISNSGLEDVFNSSLNSVRKHVAAHKDSDRDRFLFLRELEETVADFKIRHDKVIYRKSLYSRVKVMEQRAFYSSLANFIELVEDFTKVWLYREKYGEELKSHAIHRLLRTINIGELVSFLKTKTTFGYIGEIYPSLINLIQDPANCEKYLKYKRCVNKNITKLGCFERGFHYSNLMSFCIYEPNFSSEFDFKNELFELYEIFLSREYFKNKHNLYLDASFFRGALLRALAQKKMRWAKIFVSRYARHATPKFRDDLFNYGFAMIAVEEHEHDVAMELMNKIKFPSLIFKYDFNALKLKLYYENGEKETAKYQVQTCLQFLRDDEFRQKHDKEYYRVFFKCCGLLLGEDSKEKFEELELCRSKIIRTRQVACRQWLLEQIEEVVPSVSRETHAKAIERMKNLGVGI